MGFLRWAEFKLPRGRGSAHQRIGVSGYEGERLVGVETFTRPLEGVEEPWARVWWFPEGDVPEMRRLLAAFAAFDFHACQHIAGLEYDGHKLRGLYVEDAASLSDLVRRARELLGMEPTQMDALLKGISKLGEEQGRG